MHVDGAALQAGREDGPTASFIVTGLTGRRVMHGGYTKTGTGAGSSVSTARIGSAAGVTSASDTSVSDWGTGYQTLMARSDSDLHSADSEFAALVVVNGDYTPAKQDIVNDWAETYRGATL